GATTYALPYRRFVGVLTNANARLGADVDRYTFIVVDLHHLLLAGLPAHFESYMPSHAVSLSAIALGLERPVASRWSAHGCCKVEVESPNHRMEMIHRIWHHHLWRKDFFVASRNRRASALGVGRGTRVTCMLKYDVTKINVGIEKCLVVTTNARGNGQIRPSTKRSGYPRCW